ncbi:DNA ligase [Stenotrophomonas terrae]|nr:DNA ligase [Stenotrophomonas terrae]
MMRLLLLLLCCLGSVLGHAHAAPPPLMLAGTWQDGPDVSLYLVSEKLDGVRARWDGQALWTRAGHRIAAPVWFTQGWPGQAMDGELWMARGQFEATSALIRSSPGDEAQWRRLRFMTFDLPDAAGGFADRHAQLKRMIAAQRSPHLLAIEQQRLPDSEGLHRQLRAVVAAGAEGLMLHHQDNPYSDGRSPRLLKLKLYDDAEARVIGYAPGKGKYSGMVGALLMRSDSGAQFRIGSGLSDAQRIDPPAIGSQVTYRYNGLTVHGLPRFPRFLRVRDEP